jgi:hypothetical protein
MNRWYGWLVVWAVASGCAPAVAQSLAGRDPVAAADPTAHGSGSPKAVPGSESDGWKTFTDPVFKVSFRYPTDWIFARKDREISTFRLDARTAERTAVMRAVASVPENPFPASTLSGAYFYLSVTPRSTDALCASQAAGPETGPVRRPEVSQIGGLSFAHGHDEQHQICTTARDEVYTVFHRGACYRFDLSANTFCGGAVSGVKDITPDELKQVFERLQGILETVRFDSK